MYIMSFCMKICLYETSSWFSTGHGGKVYRLQKSMYRLKQTPRCWFTKLTSALKDSGFKQSYSDYSLFTYSTSDIFLCVSICQ